MSLTLSLALGLALVALAWPDAAPDPEPRPEPPEAAAEAPQPEPPRVAIAAVALPPPPAPAPAPAPEPVAKPAPPPPEPERRVAALKPAPPAKPVPVPETPVLKALKPVPTPRPEAIPAPRPETRHALKPAPHPAPKPAPEPEPAAEAPPPVPKVVATEVAEPRPAPIPTPDVVPVTAKTVVQGRTLLRLLEHGSGPGIEIAWPASARAREALYDRFRACYGMKVALLLEGERLYGAEEAPGTDWRLNTDRYSGFMRRPAGRLSPRERADIARVRARHGLDEGVPVRIFPRRVDALLLGGLGLAVGADYAGNRVIHARYRLDGSRVWVEDISADGRPVAGRVDLGPAAGHACRGART